MEYDIDMAYEDRMEQGYEPDQGFDNHLEMDYEDRNGCGYEYDGE